MTIATTLIVVSDRAAAGDRADATADLLRPVLSEAGFEPIDVQVVPDERTQIADALRTACERSGLVLTTGGTGVAPRDVTPEATRDVIELEVPGLAEEMRRRSAKVTLHALGSRALAGVRGRAVIVNLPGRPQGAVECFGFLAPVLPHLVALRQCAVDDDSHATAPGNE